MNSNFLEKMSVRTKNIIFNIVLGTTFLGSMFMCVETVRTLKVIGSLSLMLTGILVILDAIWTYFINGDEDEMFKSHMISAKAKTLEIITGGLFVYAILSSFIPSTRDNDWRILAFAAIGLSRILTGIYFMNLERKGELY